LRLFRATAQMLTARRWTKRLTCTYSWDRFSSTENFSDNLRACQAVGGRLAVDNRRYTDCMWGRLYCCCLHCRTCACEKKL